MKTLDIDKIIGRNLRRLRENARLTQAELGAMIDAADSRISAYETGREGMGKDYIERICKALKVALWEFYIDDDTPIISDQRERTVLEVLRQAEALGVAEDIARYGKYRVNEAKQAENDKSQGKGVRASRHKRRAG